jgi:hypothetical protein
MKKVKLILMITVVGLFSIAITSCSKTEGCTSSIADNYDSDADDDDGSCRCSGTIIFDNHVNEDYTITSSTGNTWIVNAYGIKSIDLSGVGECHTYTVTDESNGGTLIGTRSHCACDGSKTIDIN